MPMVTPKQRTYYKWMLQNELFPPNHPSIIEHNINLLNKYYTRQQHNQLIHTYITPYKPKTQDSYHHIQ